MTSYIELEEDRHFQTDWDILNINWENFSKHLKDDLNVNFSNKSSDILYGDDWLKFISSSKAVIGSNSGSSILVKNHEEMLELKKKSILNSKNSNFKREELFSI